IRVCSDNGVPRQTGVFRSYRVSGTDTGRSSRTIGILVASVRAVKITVEAARRFLVARHFRSPHRSLKGGPKAVLEVLKRLGSIQVDPIAAAGRNHDLVLHARGAGYDPVCCDQLYVPGIFE